MAQDNEFIKLTAQEIQNTASKTWNDNDTTEHFNALFIEFKNKSDEEKVAALAAISKKLLDALNSGKEEDNEF